MVNWENFYKKKLGDLIQRINEAVGDIRTKRITETNSIINATTTLVTRKLGKILWWWAKRERRTEVEKKNKTIS